MQFIYVPTVPAQDSTVVILIFCQFFSFKFGSISLMLHGLYLRESNTWERLNLAGVRYTYSIVVPVKNVFN